VVHAAGGARVEARAVVIATGVSWRRLGVPRLEALVGAGVFYGAAAAEARAMSGRDLYVIGAGNSAGQAALHLARYAASVTMVVRGPDLRASMSSYLVTEISTSASIRVRTGTEVIDGHGEGSLDGLTLRHRDTGATETVPAAGLFVMIGAEPRTGWLAGCVERDGNGFIHRPGPVPDRSAAGGLAVAAAAVAAGNERSRGLRRGRRAAPVHQAGRLRGGRGRDRDPARARLPGLRLAGPSAQQVSDQLPDLLAVVRAGNQPGLVSGVPGQHVQLAVPAGQGQVSARAGRLG
jgi:hypothetical protein